MKIAVIGAGAMGSLFAARLAECGRDVSLVEVAPAMIESIASRGLRMSGVFGQKAYDLPIRQADGYDDVFDLLIVFTKGMHTASAIAAAAHTIGPRTMALTVQNGIGNVEAIGKFIPRERIAMGITNWPSTLVEPGLIDVAGEGEVRLWSACGDASDDIVSICSMIDAAGLRCRLDRDVEVAIWEKLAFNAALNSLSAVTGLTVGEMGDRPESRAVVFEIVDEVVAIAKAKGLAVDRERVRHAVEHAFANHRQHKPSMLQDRLAGRRMEIGTITGAASLCADEVAFDAPVTATFARLLTLFDGRAFGG